MGPVPLGMGVGGEERFPYLGKPFHQWGNQLGQEGNFRGYWRRAHQLVCGRQDRVRLTQTDHATALYTPA